MTRQRGQDAYNVDSGVDDQNRGGPSNRTPFGYAGQTGIGPQQGTYKSDLDRQLSYGRLAGGGTNVGTPRDESGNVETDRLFFGGDSGVRGGYMDEKGNWIPQMQGLSGAEQAAEDYRRKAGVADTRGSVQLQYGNANSYFDRGESHRQDANVAREQQRNALYLTGEAAKGNAPSRAEILGRGLIDQGLKAQLAGGASARGGPLAQMAAQRHAAQGGAAFTQAGMNQLSALRADEMERNRAAYANQAGAIRQQDYTGQGLAYGAAGQQANMAENQGQLDFGQRQLNDQRSMGYEQMGWNTQNEQANRNLDYRKSTDQNALERWKHQSGLNAGNTKATTGAVTGAAGSALGAMMMFSDVRVKKPAKLDLGGTRPSAEAPNWLDDFMHHERREDALQAAREEHKDRLKRGDPNEPGFEFQPRRGVAGAPEGYAASREGQPGSMFGHSPDVDTSISGLTNDTTDAPGWDDWQRYGASAELEGDPDWSRGGSTKPNAGTTESVGRWLFGRYSSDENAKKKAFQEGVFYGEATLAGKSPEPPDYIKPKQAGAPGTAKPLLITHPKTAASIDPKARGEKPSKPTYDTTPRPPVGTIPDRETERGGMDRRAPIPQSKPKPFDPIYNPSGERAQLEEDANRKLAGQPWTYRDEFRPQDEPPGQLHYGGMTQNYEKNPITATAVRKGPNGMGQVDMPAMMQVQGSGIASLQRQIDDLELRYGDGRRRAG